jgi:hypothetical protein
MKSQMTVETIDISDGYNISQLEEEFSLIIKEAEKNTEVINSSMKMDELNEIGDEVIKAKNILSEYADSGKTKTATEQAYGHLSSIPLIGGWAKSKIKEVQEETLKNSGVRDILEGIFVSFQQKKVRLIELTEMSEKMRENLIAQEKQLIDYLLKLDKVVASPNSQVDRMKAVDMSNQVMLQKERTTDMIHNQLNFILEMMGTLYQKLSKTLPVIKNTLNDSLTIAGTINTMRDSITMMNSLEDLSNNIQRSSTENIQKLIIESTKSLSGGVDMEFFKNSAKRNEEYHKTLNKVRGEYLETSIERYQEFKELGLQTDNLLQNRVETEKILIEEKLSSLVSKDI